MPLLKHRLYDLILHWENPFVYILQRMKLILYTPPTFLKPFASHKSRSINHICEFPFYPSFLCNNEMQISIIDNTGSC